ncbi:MAG: 5'-methylthioadenosine/S-adenosylhomocysteine nucleosidase [Coriobacteriales bacterium]|jgi:adenosylhomocysteine nucleosidase|nr:5'-methylthioadenosine/S-adenosylhomocysteine nucleosidase [Coriobacteriales bacterium]
MIVILCAMKLEAKPFMKALANKKPVEPFGRRVYQGTIAGTEVVVARCGVGIQKAIAFTQTLLANLDVTQLIMSGTAGGVEAHLKIGDTVVSEELVFHDPVEDLLAKHNLANCEMPLKADSTMLNLTKEALTDKALHHAVYFGRISTGLKFASPKYFDTIAANDHPLCLDMESTAVAQVCHENHIPFIAVRSLSDSREKPGLTVFVRYASLASYNAFLVVEALLQKVKAFL